MFCFKCGKQMKLTATGYICVSGEMPLTPHLKKLLENAMQVYPVSSPIPGQHKHINWFCPRCSNRLSQWPMSQITVYCALCGLKLGTHITSNIVERHPHKEQNGTWK